MAYTGNYVGKPGVKGVDGGNPEMFSQGFNDVSL
jgi:hypothetical protein